MTYHNLTQLHRQRWRTGGERTPLRKTHKPYLIDWRQYITCCALEVRMRGELFLNCWFTTQNSTQILSLLVFSNEARSWRPVPMLKPCKKPLTGQLFSWSMACGEAKQLC